VDGGTIELNYLVTVMLGIRKLILYQALHHAGTDVVGFAGDHISQFSSVRSLLLGSYAVHYQKNSLRDAVYHENDSC